MMGHYYLSFSDDKKPSVLQVSTEDIFMDFYNKVPLYSYNPEQTIPVVFEPKMLMIIFNPLQFQLFGIAHLSDKETIEVRAIIHNEDDLYKAKQGTFLLQPLSGQPIPKGLTRCPI